MLCRVRKRVYLHHMGNYTIKQHRNKKDDPQIPTGVHGRVHVHDSARFRCVSMSVSVAVTVFVVVYMSVAEFDRVIDSACFRCCFHVCDRGHGQVSVPVHVQRP